MQEKEAALVLMVQNLLLLTDPMGRLDLVVGQNLRPQGPNGSPSSSREEQHNLGFRLLLQAHNIAVNSAVFHFTLCTDIT